MASNPHPAQAIYLCRHAQTRLNSEGLLRGHLDPSLDSTGRAQAYALGDWLGSVGPVRVASSPLTRAVQTARAIVSGSGFEVTVEERLIDRDYGEWAGRSPQDVFAQCGSVENAPGVEPRGKVLARAREALADQLAHAEHGPVVLVSHDIVNRILLAFLDPSLGEPEAISQHTACWNRLLYGAQGWVVDLVDQQTPAKP